MNRGTPRAIVHVERVCVLPFLPAKEPSTHAFNHERVPLGQRLHGSGRLTAFSSSDASSKADCRVSFFHSRYFSDVPTPSRSSKGAQAHSEAGFWLAIGKLPYLRAGARLIATLVDKWGMGRASLISFMSSNTTFRSTRNAPRATAPTNPAATAAASTKQQHHQQRHSTRILPPHLHELFALLDLLHDRRRSIFHLPQLLDELLVTLQQVLRPVARGDVEISRPLAENFLRFRADDLTPVPWEMMGR